MKNFKNLQLGDTLFLILENNYYIYELRSIFKYNDDERILFCDPIIAENEYWFTVFKNDEESNYVMSIFYDSSLGHYVSATVTPDERLFIEKIKH